MPRVETPLGVLDIFLAVLVGAVAAGAVALQIVVVPRFLEMFAEFGSALPLVTRLVAAGWLMPVAALLTVALGGAGLWQRARGAGVLGLSALCVALGLGAAADVFCLYALYAPIFELSGKIKP